MNLNSYSQFSPPRTFLTSSDIGNCTNIGPAPYDVGITGTPVIDITANLSSTSITTGALYVVAKMKDSNGAVYHQSLFAIDVTNGNVIAETDIAAAITNAHATVTFNPQWQNQRGALLGVSQAAKPAAIYITWASHCDSSMPADKMYNGWVMEYQLSGSTLNQPRTWITVSNPSGKSNGGIWQGASGPAADPPGNLYFAVGNGPFDLATTAPPDTAANCTTPPCSYGDTIVKLSPSLAVLDFFAPFDVLSTRPLKTKDYDTGSGGVMLLPPQGSSPSVNLMAQSGKEGNIYLLNSATGNMGGWNGGSVPPPAETLVQAIYLATCYQTGFNPPAVECGVWGAPAWWTTNTGGGSSTGYAFFAGKNDFLQQYQFTFVAGVGSFSAFPTHQSLHTFNFPGATPTVSAPTVNSSLNSASIVWALDTSGALNQHRAILIAYKASDLTCLYATATVSGETACRIGPAADALAGIAVKFTVPTVANGRVFVGTADNSGNGNGFITAYGVQ